MTSTTREAGVLKQDARGRVLVTVARRAALLEEFERSGSSAMRFARLAGIKYSTFANWVQARRWGRALVRPATLEGSEGGAPAGSGGEVRLFAALVEGVSGGARRRDGRREYGSSCRAGAGWWWSLRCICKWRWSWWR